MVAGAEASSTGTVSQETTDGAWAGAGEISLRPNPYNNILLMHLNLPRINMMEVVVYALNAIFVVMAIIFSGLFTWGRGCCASATPPS